MTHKAEIKHQLLVDALEKYYRGYANCNSEFTHWTATEDAMERFVSEHPDSSVIRRREQLYREIAGHCLPHIFPAYPFFFEIGMRYSTNWGTPQGRQPNAWQLQHPPRFEESYYDAAEKLRRYAMNNPSREHPLLWNIYNTFGFDVDHHSVGYSRILPLGVLALQEKITPRQNDKTLSLSEHEELSAMLAGLDALLEIATKFAVAAEVKLADAADSEERSVLVMIAAAARRIPAHPPETFHEGLAALLFYREVIASLDGRGISSLGRPDLLLIELYRNDLATGRVTEEEATELVEQWLLVHDVKCFVRENKWPETSTCMTLGGCDENGTPVFNELTRLFLTTHARLKLLNPKLNCRVSPDAPQEYLELMAELLLQGHNQFAWLNDAIQIPSLIRYGKTLTDARNYVNGGCQETICEGVEHSAGGFFYINMPECLHLWFTGNQEDQPLYRSETGLASIQQATTFGEFYADWLDNLERVIRAATGWARYNGQRFSEIAPAPLFSATLAGCVENARDYTAGGARYNPTGVTLAGLANVINSLSAVRQLVFVEQTMDLNTYINAVRSNWDGEYAVLRERVLTLPGLGKGNQAVDELAARFSGDVAAIIRRLPNERGDFYQPGYFIYWFFKHMGDHTGATPDGRRTGAYLAQGISPSRDNAPSSITDVLRSLSAIDFADFPGNSVLDWQLPIGARITPSVLAALVRRAMMLGIPTIQPNCVDLNALRQAQVEPEKYADIVVRISGLSAVFVRLDKEVQDEIISRTQYQYR